MGATYPPTTTLRLHQVVLFDVDAGVQIGSIAGDQTSATMAEGTHGLHTLRVTYPVGWVGNAVTMTGPDRGGASQSETFTVPGAGAGGTVEGTKVFGGVVTGAAAGGLSGALTATIEIGERLCLASAPVTAVRSCASFGADHTVSSVDKALGTFKIESGPITNEYHVIYEVSA